LNREVLAQESQKLKLDQSAQAKEQKKTLEQNLLIELLFNDYLAKNPVTDAAVKEEFDRQVQEAKTNELQEYRVRNLVLQKEADAKAAIAKLKKGADFAAVDKEYSADPAKATGGDVGWVLAQQIVPQIRGVVVNLNKGSVTNEPIRTAAGWHVVKLEDVRPFKAPAFDEVKNQLKAGLIQKKRADLVIRLKQQAKIE
jgi:peptidyl-prolyl cis-trans isomerase C